MTAAQSARIGLVHATPALDSAHGSIVPLNMANFAEALSLVALVAATLEYAILVGHREERREEIRWRIEVRDSLMWARRLDSSAG